MPIEQSIQWKPLRDPHYIVASLQPADGGRRKIFVRQQVIARVEALVRSHARRAVGLLLGQLYQCSVTGTDYVVVESLSESGAVGDEHQMATKVAEAMVSHEKEHHLHLLGLDHRADVVGWYRGAPAIEARPSLTTAGVHASLFNQPWHMTLVVSEGSSPDGAIFLRDSVNSRWFYAPFYELLRDVPATSEPKATVIAWAQYLTAEPVIPAERELRSQAKLAAKMGSADTARQAYERPWLRRSSSNQNGVERNRTQDAEVPLIQSSRPSPVPTDDPSDAALGPLPERALADQPVADRPVIDLPVADGRMADLPLADLAPLDRPPSDRPAPQPRQPGIADAPRGARERIGARRGGGGRSPEKLSIVDDGDQRAATKSSMRRVGDDDDTLIGDDPGRYIDLARAEGFFIAGKFEAIGDLGGAETLWVLNEPYSGILLAVVTTSSQVVDATLHYNLQTDDAGLKMAPFPEHRDPESKTIYVRETCVDSLRARCRRVRATNSLLREWKVTPAISFLTPGEWESIPVSGGRGDRGAHVISDLNRKRIAELPPGVRSQFHLSDGGAEASA